MIRFDLRRRVRPVAAEVAAVDAKGLVTELKRRVEGEVRFDEGSRALYATDGSNYRHVPIGVVLPRHKGDIVATVAACREFGAPVLPRGGGTGLAGQTCNTAVVVDTTKYLHSVLELDPQARRARVEPGTNLDALRHQAEEHHLTFAPDPATHTHCTLGGMIGNNSCGIHSVMGGKTEDNIEALEVLTYDGLRMWVGKTGDDELARIIGAGGRRGEIYRRLRELGRDHESLIRARFPNIPRRVSGYNLNHLLPENGFDVAKALVGSEGTCVFVLEAVTRLVYSPPGRSLLVLGYPDVYSAADHVPEILEYGPVGLEGIDDGLIQDMERKHLHERYVDLLPKGGGWLLVEMGGEDREESDEKARRLMRALKGEPDAPTMKLFDDPLEEHKVWKVRESGLGATANVPNRPLTWPGWEDAAVPPERAGAYLRDFRKLLDKYGYSADLYGHFGQGCIHCRISFDLFTAEGVKAYRSFLEEAAALVTGYGGSLSGEHGDGQSRAELLPIMFGEEMVGLFREFKNIWDPDWKMNPGKIVNPFRVDQSLRLGPSYNPPEPATAFAYPDDKFSFARATLRCVGVGDCRRTDEGTMCPSYMATREEMHSTRGRARLLFEMLQGDPLRGAWKSEHVKEALDLCLSCKGCKGECPVNVDMATYKAEFLSHYFETRRRPRTAYAFGLIYWWARAASVLPGMANFVTQTPPLSNLVKAAGGIHPSRQLPPFAPETFKRWFFQRGERNVGARRVLLWADTWCNHFYPEVAQAAVEVLEAAGFHVTVPRHSLCCGRPLYDYGFLDLAKRLLKQVMEALAEELEEGVPIVVLEPSCLSVFQEELGNLFPSLRDADRLSRQSLLLSEFLLREAPEFTPPPLTRKALVHGHCHQKSVLDMDADEQVMKQMGLDFTLLDSGCCGMAGPFGFETGHYQVSQDCGERVLLPEVEQAPKDTLLVTNGFSCREMILQNTDRNALHLAQVIQMALRDGTDGPPGDYPERRYFTDKMAGQLPPAVRTALVAGAGAILAGGAAWMWRRGNGRGA